jgi:hypothetical protein
LITSRNIVLLYISLSLQDKYLIALEARSSFQDGAAWRSMIKFTGKSIKSRTDPNDLEIAKIAEDN